ncbi:MAG: PepSY domain-containing protein [Gammaproteobacteria bacterium]
MRKLFVLIHRYAGLVMTVFLILVGVTGSVLAFYQELDRWLNPELLTVPVRDGPMLDPFTLRELASIVTVQTPAHCLADEAFGQLRLMGLAIASQGFHDQGIDVGRPALVDQRLRLPRQLFGDLGFDAQLHGVVPLVEGWDAFTLPRWSCA